MSDDNLLNAFRSQYHQLQAQVQSTLSAPTDSTVLERLGDQVDTFQRILEEVCQTAM